MTLTDPARLSPGDLLAALGELGCVRAAQVYAALGYPVVPMHAAQPDGGCTCPGSSCPEAGKHPRLRGWQRLATNDPALAREWWRRWPDAKLARATGRRFDVLDLDSDQGAVRPHRPRQPGQDAARGGLAGPRWTDRSATLPPHQRPPLHLGAAPDGDPAQTPAIHSD